MSIGYAKSPNYANSSLDSKKRIIPKDTAQTICLSIVLYVYFIGFFTYNFGLPIAAYYVTDALLILCLLLSVDRLGKAVFSDRLRWFSAILAALVVVSTLSALINGFRPLLWLWSLRNWGRFFLFFYLCVALLDEEWASKMLSLTVSLFLVNVVVVIVQFVMIEGVSQDALNGLVGRDTSGVHIVLALAAVAIVSAEYCTSRCRIWKLAVVFVGVMVVSVLAELKATMFFAVAIFTLIYVVCRVRSWGSLLKLLAFVIVAAATIVVGASLLNSLYPLSGIDLSLEGIIRGVSAEGGYGHNGKIDRLTAIDVVNRDIFVDDGLRQAFGVGMGNAEYGSVGALQSAFFNEYGAEYAYLRFNVSSLYIESGYIGLALYISLFVILIVSTAKQARKRTGGCLDEMRLGRYEAVGLGAALIGLVFIWYNNLLRTDIAVLLAFYIAIPFALTRKDA